MRYLALFLLLFVLFIGGIGMTMKQRAERHFNTHHITVRG